jgi:alpha-beta hydrolase superfamily lysophospholipase
LLHPSKRAGVVQLTAEQFNYGFTNTFPPEAAAAAYERYAVPETGRIFFEGALANFELHSPLAVDYAKADRAPLLITAGGSDHIVPPAISHAAFEKYRASSARTDYVEFPEMPHLLMVAPGWEKVAGYVAGWLADALPAAAVPQASDAATRESPTPSGA